MNIVWVWLLELQLVIHRHKPPFQLLLQYMSLRIWKRAGSQEELSMQASKIAAVFADLDRTLHQLIVPALVILTPFFFFFFFFVFLFFFFFFFFFFFERHLHVLVTPCPHLLARARPLPQRYFSLKPNLTTSTLLQNLAKFRLLILLLGQFLLWEGEGAFFKFFQFFITGFRWSWWS
jgi:hypothetical protein